MSERLEGKIQTQDIKRYKQLIRQETKRLFPITDESVCANCQDIDKLDHHHLDRDPFNNTPNNVIVLCHKCHLRRHRIAREVGNRTKLTRQQIDAIKQSSLSGAELGRLHGICASYANRIRNGKKNPKPVTEDKPITGIPEGWEPRKQGKPRSLEKWQVEIIRSRKMSKAVMQKHAKWWDISIATMYKAKAGRGCYDSL